MKAPLVCTIALCLAASLWAQAPAVGGGEGAYSPEQLDQMLGPIALYPDPLVALILPASTAPSDLTLAAAYLAANGDPAGIDAQPWDASVKGLARYPTVLQWMAGNLDWTQALGAAFAQQPADVMKSIQQLRAQAVAAGTLVNTPQQQVVMEGDDITIVPTQQDLIYVPQYDPDAVYDGSGTDLITFGPGYPVGAWLGYECDWDDFGIWVAPWHAGWAYRRDWRDARTGGRAWRPDPGRVRPVVRNFYRPGANPPRPRPSPGARAPAERPRLAPRAAAPAPVSRPDSRGWQGTEAPRAAPARPPGALYGGYNRGTQTRSFSERGQASRQAPVRTMAPRAAPARAAAPPRPAAPAARGNERR